MLRMISGLAVITAVCFSSILRAQVRHIKINPSATFQTIENFAASDAWSGNFVGKHWNEKQKEQIAEWLFSRETGASGNPKGIGLSLWRVNVGAGTWEQADADILPMQRRAESFMTVDGKGYDWGKCLGQQYFMEQAVKHGCNNFLLFSNSPLVQYTLNGKGWSNSENAANITPEGYHQYAEYLADVTLHYRKKGWNISYISPINEPQVKWDTPRQEGTPWRKSEVKKMFVALNQALSAKKELSDVKMLLGETGNLKYAYQPNENLRKRFGGEEAPDDILKAYFDPNSQYYIGNLVHLPRIIASHAYGNHTKNQELREARTNLRALCEQYDVDYHQSEWCLLPNLKPPMDGFTAGWPGANWGDMQVGLLLGRLVYSDFVDGNAKAWGYWKGMELKGDHALIALHAQEGNIFNGGTVTANKLLWALGNYSFFVQPGYTRIDVEGADDLNTLVASSYISPDRSRIVTVFVNSSFDAQDIAFELPAKDRDLIQHVSAYQTNERSDLVHVPFAIGSGLTYTVQARTIATVVFDLKNQNKGVSKALITTSFEPLHPFGAQFSAQQPVGTNIANKGFVHVIP